MKRNPIKEAIAIQRKRRLREMYPDSSPGRKRLRNPIKKEWLFEQKEKLGGYEIGSI